MPQSAVDLKTVFNKIIVDHEKEVEKNKIITQKLTEKTLQFDAFALRADNFFNILNNELNNGIDRNFRQLALDINTGFEKPIAHVLTTAVNTLKEQNDATTDRLIDLALKQNKWSALTGTVTHFISGACGGLGAIAVITGHQKYLLAIPVLLVLAWFISHKFSK